MFLKKQVHFICTFSKQILPNKKPSFLTKILIKGGFLTRLITDVSSTFSFSTISSTPTNHEIRYHVAICKSQMISEENIQRISLLHRYDEWHEHSPTRLSLRTKHQKACFRVFHIIYDSLWCDNRHHPEGFHYDSHTMLDA